MQRNQGFIALAIVLVGAMFRPVMTGGSSAIGRDAKVVPYARKADLPSVVAPIEADGPWKASCNYWRPGQTSDNTAECGKTSWGIPVDSGDRSKEPPITAIIATVPDPIHGAMPMEFDRTIEVITQAASEYKYVGSYFWLPWRPRHSDKSRPADDAESSDSKESELREMQPGLLILKQPRAIPKIPSPSVKNSDETPGVIYLFLVGQSPALGVNGAELRNALQYEQYLHTHYGVKLSFKTRRTSACGPHAPQALASAGDTLERPPSSTGPNPSDTQLPSSTDLSNLDVIGPNNSGSAASLRAALESMPAGIECITVAGITSTVSAADVISSAAKVNPPTIRYISFADNSKFESDSIVQTFARSEKSSSNRIAFLLETGTVFGQFENNTFGGAQNPLIIHFPRNISLLRNAQKDQASTPESAASAATPYLHLSLKDTSAEDNIPAFSPELAPFSQEAQWISIARELRRGRINTVAIAASNILDELFLVTLLHRDVPDAQVVLFDYADLLFARVGDNQSYVGAVTFTAYPLTGPGATHSSVSLESFADSITEAYFNAVAYTFWDGQDVRQLHLAEYGVASDSGPAAHPALWATAVGRDGYYPLGLVKNCASDDADILPTIADGNLVTQCVPAPQPVASLLGRSSVAPGFSWYLICIALTALCVAHGVLLHTANLWSPLTRDLAIGENDQPRRRSVYIHIAVAMLFCMTSVTAIPLVPAWSLLQPGSYTAGIASMTFLSGIFAVGLTLARTRRYLHHRDTEPKHLHDAPSVTERRQEAKDTASESSFYPFFNFIAAASAIVVPLLWWGLCTTNSIDCKQSYVGLFFSYRCLYPASGVCPLVPVLLILLTWYIWAHLQTRRLRFSENSRPMLPPPTTLESVMALYVSDQALNRCGRATDSCLFENINCLLITRQLIRRYFHRPKRYLNATLGTAYVVLFICFVLFLRIRGLEYFLRPERFFPGPYEALICALFFPLLVIAISGFVRIVVIWTSLNRGLLEPLERSPLRFAFSRLTNVAWMTMLRQSGVFEYWRDMARSTESMRQLVHQHWTWARHTRANCNGAVLAESTYADLRRHLALLIGAIRGPDAKSRAPGPIDECLSSILQHLSPHETATTNPTPEGENFLLGDDLPCDEVNCLPLNLMCAIESDYARFAQSVLYFVLAPFWIAVGRGPVEAELSSGEATAPPAHIVLAEEFVVIRYLSLIRMVLINLRLLMTFVSISFVFSLLAWNSYPFQPRQWVDWTFTILLFGIGAGVVWVFAQMHRSAILSRITGTKVNELGGDFFFRLFTYGAVPFLTWVAAQFPAIGHTVSKLLQSGLSTSK